MDSNVIIASVFTTQAAILHTEEDISVWNILLTAISLLTSEDTKSCLHAGRPGL